MLAVGATTPVPVDVRVVAATHGDVHALAARGARRPDFLARLAGFQVRLPPLRDRPEDIGQLAVGFLRDALGPRFAKLVFDNDVACALLRYPWPLNVRELERTIGAAAVLIEDRVTLAVLDDRLLGASAAIAREASEPSACSSSRDNVAALLRSHRGNISRVARALCTSRSHVYRLLARYGLSARGLDPG